MRALKFAAPLGLAIACVAASALAQNVNYVSIANRERHAVSVDVRVGLSKNCAYNTTAATITIGGKAVEKITITAERYMCLRLSGTSTWRLEPLAGGRDYSFTIN